MGYIEFLESHLGEIQIGWSIDEDCNNLPYHVVRYVGGPFDNTKTHSTIGLSKTLYHGGLDGKHIRFELFILTPNFFGDRNIPALLQQAAKPCIEHNQVYLKGEIIRYKGVLFEGYNMEALYVTHPAYFHEDFDIYWGEEGIPIVQIWLVPITSKEAEFIRQNGWSKFEDLLIEKDPDLLDFSRGSIV